MLQHGSRSMDNQTRIPYDLAEISNYAVQLFKLYAIQPNELRYSGVHTRERPQLRRVPPRNLELIVVQHVSLADLCRNALAKGLLRGYAATARCRPLARWRCLTSSHQ